MARGRGTDAPKPPPGVGVAVVLERVHRAAVTDEGRRHASRRRRSRSAGSFAAGQRRQRLPDAVDLGHQVGPVAADCRPRSRRPRAAAPVVACAAIRARASSSSIDRWLDEPLERDLARARRPPRPRRGTAGRDAQGSAAARRGPRRGRSPPAAARRSAMTAPMAGWVMALRAASDSASAKATAASAGPVDRARRASRIPAPEALDERRRRPGPRGRPPRGRCDRRRSARRRARRAGRPRSTSPSRSPRSARRRAPDSIRRDGHAPGVGRWTGAWSSDSTAPPSLRPGLE